MQWPVSNFDDVSSSSNLLPSSKGEDDMDWFRRIDVRNEYVHFSMVFVLASCLLAELSTVFLNLRELALRLQWRGLYTFSGIGLAISYPTLRIPWMLYAARIAYTGNWFSAFFYSPRYLMLGYCTALFVAVMSSFYSIKLFRMGSSLFIMKLKTPSKSVNGRGHKKEL